MPRVKIDYVVSFSSEDPENQASNLLLWEVSKKRWLCRAGEPCASVVLQLSRAVQISSLQIGAYHAALVEVLGGRSATPDAPYEVLVPRSVFVGPRESRGAGVERVRAPALCAAAAAQRWDRLRLVCQQPYNKHCSYGISFVHVFEPDEDPPAPPPPAPPAPALPARMFALDACSSDEEEFSPGELFAKHRLSGGDPGAQIRQATSLALKNNSEAAAKLVKTPLGRRKPAPAPSPGPRAPRDARRDKDDLLYTEDDELPHAKIDHVIQRHKDEVETPKPKETNKKTDKNRTPHSTREPSSGTSSENRRDKEKRKKEPDNDGRDAAGSADPNGNSSKKPARPDGREAEEEEAPGPRSARPLEGVVFVLSGYRNPRLQQLRRLAERLGARARKHWAPDCTHLICAFSRTPKLAAVRAAPGGARVPAPGAAWLQQCARRGRRLPWRWFAAEPERRLAPPGSSDECDADDETALPSGASDDDDYEMQIVEDERIQGGGTQSDSDAGDTDVEEAEPRGGRRGRGRLPALLAGRRLRVAGAGPLDARLLARYCKAYGGLLVESEDEDSIVLCGRRGTGGRGRRVRGDWLWASHAAAQLLPLEDYLLQ